MRRKFTIAIPTPCHENWDQFTPTQKGRFCGVCQKEVIDFTTWSEEEIKQYFISPPASTCGRFASHQLTTYHHRPAKDSTIYTRWAAAITLLLALVSRPAEALQPQRTRQEQVDTKRKTTTVTIPTDSVEQITIRGVVVIESQEEHLPGVNIVRKGTTQGTVTDADGKFEMVIDHPNAVETIVASFIGLTNTEYQVRADTTFREVKINMTYEYTGGISVVAGGVVALPWYHPRRIWWGIKSIFRRY